MPGIENHLFTGEGSELAIRARRDGINVIHSRWHAGLSLSAFRTLGLAIGDIRPDIVHVHDSHALTLALWLRTLGLRWFVHSKQLPPEPYAIFAHRRVDFHVKTGSGWHRADRILAVSEGVKRVLVADGISPRDIVVIHDGIDPDEIKAEADSAPDIRTRLHLPAEAPLAVNVAALVDHKDQRTLVRAAAAARARAPQLHWVIAGEGPLREALQRDITNLGVGDIVHMVGYVDPVDALIRESRVFVMSSKEEGMGSVVLHALALSRPVVATAGGGLPEIVSPEWVVPVGNPEALADSVLKALAHPARRPFEYRFTSKAMAEATLAQYRVLA